MCINAAHTKMIHSVQENKGVNASISNLNLDTYNAESHQVMHLIREQCILVV